MKQPALTIIIPAYNEARTILDVLEAVSACPYEAQIVVVDDGSRDGTQELVEGWLASRNHVCAELVCHPVNRGKGAAIRTGLGRAVGYVSIVQDADLEYDVADYPRIVDPILEGRALVVYGSRYLRPAKPLPWTPQRICVHFLNAMVWALYGMRVTDEATCYKAFRTDVLRGLDLRCERFEFCPEVTAKVGRLGLGVLEVPISYRPRGHAEGKKIRWHDGIEAILTLLRWKFARIRSASDLGPLSIALVDAGPSLELKDGPL